MRYRSIAILCSAILGLMAVAALAGGAGARYPSQAQNMQSDAQSRVVVVPHALGDWPMYGHDVSRTNYNPDETTINAGNLSQLISRWQANLGSNGTAPSGAPSVANGKVFVGSSVATGNDFFAFDAVAGGPPLWSANLNYQSSCFNVGIGSTSAISGTMLSVGGGDPAFYGLNTETGAIMWRNPMNLGSSGFPWESPLLANDRAYLGMASRCDNPSVRGEARAVQLADGTPVANQYFVPSGQAGAGIWNSPALSPDGSTLVVVTGEDYNGYNGPYNRAIVSLDPITLQILQSNQQGSTGADADYGSTPAIFHDSTGRILVGANHKNGVFYAFVLNNINAGPIWQKSTGTQVGMMPAYDPTFGNGGTLFIGGSGGKLYAVDPATGSDRWPFVTPGTMRGNMAIANHLIYVNVGSSGLKILDETNGSTLRTLTPSNAGSANSGLSVSNGFIYWLSGSYINAWSLGGTPAPTNTPTDTAIPTQTIPPTQTALPTNTPTYTATNAPTSTSQPATFTTIPTLGTGTPQPPTFTPASTSTPTASPTCGPFWRTVTTPNPSTDSNYLYGITARASNDVWAVGSADDQPLIERWDGASWNVATTPNLAGTLRSVSSIAANDAYAAGNAGSETLILHWDGAQWTQVPSPNPGSGDHYLNGVAAVEANDVWAVGYTTSNNVSHTLIAHWNGSQWSVVPSPDDARYTYYLTSVAAISANDVWAIGHYNMGATMPMQTLALHWNGALWNMVPSPDTANSDYLNSVTAINGSDVWAVGYSSDLSNERTLTMRWNGAQWSIVSSPSPGANSSIFYGASAVNQNEVWAVGFIQGTGPAQALIERWNGSQWSVVPDPNSGTGGNYLYAADPAAPDDLWTAGYYLMPHYPENNHLALAIERLNPPCVSPTPTLTVTPYPTPTLTVTPCPISFTDVHPSDYFYIAVRYLYCAGVISGYADNTFRPFNNTTRGQLSKIVVLAEGWMLECPSTAHFTDVPVGSPFFCYVETAFSHGVISGYADETFRPGNNVTRGQLCKIVVQAQQWPIDTTGGPHFTDVPQSQPFYTFIETAYNHGVISGYTDGAFRPNNDATRGQISKIVYSAITGSSRR